MLLNKRKIKKDIKDEKQANEFMDKITSKLSNNDLFRAYNKAKEKHKRKNNSSTEYMMKYFKTKLIERGVFKYE